MVSQQPPLWADQGDLFGELGGTVSEGAHHTVPDGFHLVVEHEKTAGQTEDDDERVVGLGTMDLGFELPDGYEPIAKVDELMAIQDGYLVHQLALLVDKRASEAAKGDVWLWLNEPLVTSDKASRAAVLSFQRCCYAAGVDPEEFRDALVSMINKRNKAGSVIEHLNRKALV